MKNTYTSPKCQSMKLWAIEDVRQPWSDSNHSGAVDAGDGRGVGHAQPIGGKSRKPPVGSLRHGSAPTPGSPSGTLRVSTGVNHVLAELTGGAGKAARPRREREAARSFLVRTEAWVC